MSRRVILASTSPYRRALLGRLPLSFEIASPEVDEEAVQARADDPASLVRTLGLAKAQAVATRHPGAVVIGSDQCAAIDDRILGKPGTREQAVEQLMALSGRTHDLWTSVAVVDGAREEVEIDCHRLTMRPLDRATIERYVDVDDPVDCAGAYKIETAGIALFERIEGEDFTAIIGLPLTRVVRLLSHFGIAVL